jgi:hypothetical protein
MFEWGIRRDPVGCEHMTTFSHYIEAGGFREDTDLTDFEDWTYYFVQSLCDEDEKVEVEDDNDTSGLNWDEPRADDAWDDLDTAY